MHKKAFIFSLELLVALSIIFSSIYLLTTTIPFFEDSLIKEENLNVMGQDLMQFITKTRISDLQDLQLVQDYLNLGLIEYKDINASFVDVIGTFMIQNKFDYAKNLTEEVFEKLIPDNVGYQVYFDNVSIANKTISNPSSELTLKTLLSGYALNRSLEGYIARAWLNLASFNETKIISISPIGSGFKNNTCVKWLWWWCTKTVEGGNLTIVKSFDIPADIETVVNAELMLSIHEEGGRVWIYVNDVLQHEEYYDDKVYERIPIHNVTSGTNVIKIIQEMPSNYHAHTHPGFLLKVDYVRVRRLGYKENKTVVIDKRFPEIIASPSVWETFSFDIPRGDNITNATLHLEVLNVDDWGEIWVNDNQVWVNSSAQGNMTIDLDILPYVNHENNVSTGETNVIAPYFDIESQNDYPTENARGNIIISNNSFVHLEYQKPETIQKYGLIPITHSFEFGGTAENDKSVEFPLSYHELINAYVHLAQIYSWKVALAAWNENQTAPVWDNTLKEWVPEEMQFFKSSTGRNVPSSIYIPIDMLVKNSTNYVEARDFGGTGNKILPESTIEYTYLAPAQVGYADVYETEIQAINDAINRLQELVAPYNITGEVNYSVSSVTNVRWLWGPAEVKVVLSR